MRWIAPLLVLITIVAGCSSQPPTAGTPSDALHDFALAYDPRPPAWGLTPGLPEAPAAVEAVYEGRSIQTDRQVALDTVLVLLKLYRCEMEQCGHGFDLRVPGDVGMLVRNRFLREYCKMLYIDPTDTGDRFDYWGSSSVLSYVHANPGFERYEPIAAELDRIYKARDRNSKAMDASRQQTFDAAR